jgi:hypothetical protein
VGSMNNFTFRSGAAVRALLAHAVEQHRISGLPLGPHGFGPWPTIEYHGYALSSLWVLPESEYGEPFVEFLRDSHLDCPLGLSVLVRIVAQSARISLLAGLLNESAELEEGYPLGPNTFEEVKDEATGLPWWKNPWYPWRIELETGESGHVEHF